MPATLYPLAFHPIFKERVWGGRRLESLFHKPLPPGVPIGESWEISDRPGDVSVIANGPLAGRDLRWLMESQGSALLGRAVLSGERFPLLIKLLDAREKLSLQVHPPADRAHRLGGDPKTEMWYIAEADSGAELYVGLKHGISRAEFETRLRQGTVETAFHRVAVAAGDAMFLPSGRVHAIGAGLVIFEIQQNSDTTYRVFDWNRTGLDGKPRALHIAESLESIDFADVEPGLVRAAPETIGSTTSTPLVRDSLFSVSKVEIRAGTPLSLSSGRPRILACVSGAGVLQDPTASHPFEPGRFYLIPAGLDSTLFATDSSASLILTTF